MEVWVDAKIPMPVPSSRANTWKSGTDWECPTRFQSLEQVKGSLGLFHNSQLDTMSRNYHVTFPQLNLSQVENSALMVAKLLVHCIFRASHVSVKKKAFKISPSNCTQRTNRQNSSSLRRIYFVKTILMTDKWNTCLAINTFWRMVKHVTHWRHKKRDKNEGENIRLCRWYYSFLYGPRKMHT